MPKDVERQLMDDWLSSVSFDKQFDIMPDDEDVDAEDED
jgi:hypothetical protein